jgi:hypothetical protein
MTRQELSSVNTRVGQTLGAHSARGGAGPGRRSARRAGGRAEVGRPGLDAEGGRGREAAARGRPASHSPANSLGCGLQVRGGHAGGLGPAEQSPHGHLEMVNRPPAQATPPPVRRGAQPEAALTVLEVHGGGSGLTGLGSAGLNGSQQQASATHGPALPVGTTKSSDTGRETAGHSEAGGGAGRRSQPPQRNLRLAGEGW